MLPTPWAGNFHIAKSKLQSFYCFTLTYQEKEKPEIEKIDKAKSEKETDSKQENEKMEDVSTSFGDTATAAGSSKEESD